STILNSDPLPIVKEAFSLLSMDESYRSMHQRVQGKRSGDNRRRFNNSNARNPSLVYKNCNMNGHTIDRCFELIGYPPNFKKKGVTSQNVTFSCFVNDSLFKSLVGTGSQREGLYFLDLGKKFVNGNITSCAISKCLWHNRLVHPADQVLNVLKDKIDLKGFLSSEACEVCHKAKQTRDPFPLSYVEN
nr:ribonuclease H-like domain-containing protein [Tanacetum cinerariifolium]